MLAEKRIDLSLYSPEAGSRKTKTKPEDLLKNEQNVRNRRWEVTYSDHIKESVFSTVHRSQKKFYHLFIITRAEAENEAWQEVGFKYKVYGEKLRASLQERAAAIYNPDQSISSTSPLTATALSQIRHTAEIEADLDKRLGSALEFKMDQISSFISTASAATYIAQKSLNERFDIIASNLKSRSKPYPHPPHGGPSATADPSSSSTQVITTYITNPLSKSTSSSRTASSTANPLDLMRALTRVDKDRPPGMVGDAAWRAAREVQRVGESGSGAVGGRRLRGVPVTPRKIPGTPRRGNTPRRDP